MGKKTSDTDLPEIPHTFIHYNWDLLPGYIFFSLDLVNVCVQGKDIDINWEKK